MDSNNINRPNSTDTPDILTENTPTDPVPPQDHFSYGNPTDVQNQPPIPNGMQNQNNSNYGMPDGTQKQNNSYYGMANDVPNQNNNHYGTSNGAQYPNNNPYENNSHYGMENGAPNQNNNPYGTPNGVPNQNSNPYGAPNGIQNQNNNPYGMPNGTPIPNSNPYGAPNGTPIPNNNPYGMPGGARNQGSNPYGAPGRAQNQNPTPYGAPNGTPYPNYYQPVQKSPADNLTTASMVLGIAAIVSAILGTVYFPFILGGISIVFALLSKIGDEKMVSKSKTGVICAVIGLVLNLFIVSTSVYRVFTDERTFNQFDRVYEQMYGESFRDMYKDVTGQDFPLDFD